MGINKFIQDLIHSYNEEEEEEARFWDLCGVSWWRHVRKEPSVCFVVCKWAQRPLNLQSLSCIISIFVARQKPFAFCGRKLDKNIRFQFVSFQTWKFLSFDWKKLYRRLESHGMIGSTKSKKNTGGKGSGAFCLTSPTSASTTRRNFSLLLSINKLSSSFRFEILCVVLLVSSQLSVLMTNILLKRTKQWMNFVFISSVNSFWILVFSFGYYSMAILRYYAKRYGMYGKDELEQFRCDMVADGTEVLDWLWGS